MPLLVFYDSSELDPTCATFLNSHQNIRWVAWNWDGGRNQREKMITAWVHVPAREVATKWYLKLDTDTLATGPGPWLKDEWFTPDSRGRTPVLISSRWTYSKPRYVMDLLDDWGDHIPKLKRFPRLNIPYSSNDIRVRHKRIISWFFIGRTDWTREVCGWLGKSVKLPHPSQDTFLFYCAKRQRRKMIRERMSKYQWTHCGLPKIRDFSTRLGIVPDA